MNWIDQTEQNRLFAWDLYYRTAVLRQGPMNSNLSFWSSFHLSVCFLIHIALFPDIAHELWDPEELKSDRVRSFVKIFIFPKTSKMGRKMVLSEFLVNLGIIFCWKQSKLKYFSIFLCTPHGWENSDQQVIGKKRSRPISLNVFWSSKSLESQITS